MGNKNHRDLDFVVISCLKRIHIQIIDPKNSLASKRLRKSEDKVRLKEVLHKQLDYLCNVS